MAKFNENFKDIIVFSTIGKFILIDIIIVILVAFYVNAMDNIHKHKSLIKYIEKNPQKYELVCEVKNNVGTQKAFIYKSKEKDIKNAVNDLIKGTPEAIEAITEEKEDYYISYGIHNYKNEFAYVYEQFGEIFVQISKDSFLENRGATVYHSNHYERFYSAFNKENISEEYKDYIKETREKSMNNRYGI